MADVKPLGDGRFLVHEGDRQTVAYAVTAGHARWVFLDGITYVIADEQTTTAHAHDDQQALAAPMPATVSSIKVAPGQQVSSGDVLIMLEAMKMELPIKAPRNATVRSVACREGELVQPGVPLLELD